MNYRYSGNNNGRNNNNSNGRDNRYSNNEREYRYSDYERDNSYGRNSGNNSYGSSEREYRYSDYERDNSYGSNSGNNSYSDYERDYRYSNNDRSNSYSNNSRNNSTGSFLDSFLPSDPRIRIGVAAAAVVLLVVMIVALVSCGKNCGGDEPTDDVYVPSADNRDEGYGEQYGQDDLFTDPSVTEPEEPAEPVDLTQYATVTVNKANLRESGSTNAAVLCTVPGEAKVVVEEIDGEWYRVTYEDKTGWMHSSCAELIRNRALEDTIFEPIPEAKSGQVLSLAGTATSTYIDQIAREQEACSVTLAVIKNGETAYHYEYGTLTRKTDQPATINTKYRIASISKVVVTMLAAKLWEDGKLDLDADISDYLGFTVRNPYYKNIPITTRMLLTHTASFHDGSPLFTGSIKNDVKNKEYYYWCEPGTNHYYSNMSVGIAGAVVEAAANRYLTDYAKEAFFDSLGMDSAFDGSKLKDTSEVSPCYSGTELKMSAEKILSRAESSPIGQNYMLGAGGLISNSVDLADLVTVLINDGTAGGTRYLSSDTIAKIHTPQIETDVYSQCIGVRRSETLIPGRTMFYHTGAAYGVFSVIAYDPADGSGVVILSTGAYDRTDDNGVRRICGEILSLLYEDMFR